MLLTTVSRAVSSSGHEDFLCTAPGFRGSVRKISVGKESLGVGREMAEPRSLRRTRSRLPAAPSP